MKFKVLGCYGGNTPGHGLTSFLVNDTVALDAGFITSALPLKDQVKIKDISSSASDIIAAAPNTPKEALPAVEAAKSGTSLLGTETV